MNSPPTKDDAPQDSAGAERSDLDAARALLAEDEQARMKACAAEIQEVLTKYGMSLEVTPSQIALVPQE